MPKINGMKWGAVTNIYPTRSVAQDFDRMLPHDKKWHEVFNDQDVVWIDGYRIKRRTVKSMT